MDTYANRGYGMILPKNLQEKRDELAKNWTKGWNTLADSENSVIALNYKKGFNDCANLLLPEIKKLREALNHYNQWSSLKEPDESDIRSDVDCGCCSQGSAGAVAYKALQSWQEFLGEV